MARNDPKGDENESTDATSNQHVEPMSGTQTNTTVAAVEEVESESFVRTSHPGDRMFLPDGTKITSDYQRFPADRVKEIQTMAKRSSVSLRVKPVEK